MSAYRLAKIAKERHLRLETMGSPALGQGSNCKLLSQQETHPIRGAYSQGVFQVLVNLHDSSLVAASVAVVGCCDQLASSKEQRDPSDVPEKIVTTFLSCDQLYPSMTSW